MELLIANQKFYIGSPSAPSDLRWGDLKKKGTLLPIIFQKNVIYQKGVWLGQVFLLNTHKNLRELYDTSQVQGNSSVHQSTFQAQFH